MGVFDAHEMVLPVPANPDYAKKGAFLLPNILAQQIIAGCVAERKKYEETLWGSTDDEPAWGVSTPDSTPPN